MLNLREHIQNVLEEERRHRTIRDLLVVLTARNATLEMHKDVAALGAALLGGQHSGPRGFWGEEGKPLEEDIVWLTLRQGETLITCWTPGLTAHEHEIYLRLRTDGLSTTQALVCAREFAQTC